MLLALFWQTIVFSFLHVVVYVVRYISFVASVIYIHAYAFFFFFKFNQCFFGVLANIPVCLGTPSAY